MYDGSVAPQPVATLTSTAQGVCRNGVLCWIPLSNGSVFRYGSFLNAVIAFLTIATAVFWLVVLPANHLMAAMRTEPPVERTTRECPECLSDVPVAARRCAFCTSALPTGPA